ncbi:MAG TPA: hypothetical protein VF719_09375 [Abditibacteriaceae bacterium]
MLITLLVLICLALGYFVFAPFLRTASSVTNADSSEPDAPTSPPHRNHANYEALVSERDRLLRSLKELEFDHSTDKIDEAEYQSQRADLSTQTSRVLDRLERLSPRGAARSNMQDTELELEVLVARARRKRATAKSSGASRWQCGCGRVMDARDAFCASCGAPRTGDSAVPSASGNLAATTS